MSFKFNKNDHQLLAEIAEHRVLTISQVTAIQRKSAQVVRRRLNKLEQEGTIVTATRGFGQGRGRPEKIVSLAKEGATLLSSKYPALRDVPINKINAEKIRCLDHQLLTNWFRIHLNEIEHATPELSIRYLSPNSPFLKQDNTDIPFIFEHLPSDDSSKNSSGFTPDGVFSISHRQKQITLLFFLEVDMGTESVASPKRDPRDIRQKIINYQEYFQSNRYKRYEKYWDCILKGFRLLFLTNTNSRLLVLSRLVQEMPPSDFIWLTSLEQMFSHGLSAEIWFRGGKQEARAESILGPYACRTPVQRPQP